MIRFILYAVLAIFVIQIVRTTMRIRSNASQWKGKGEEEEGKPPVLNIPDIQDAKFEDITNAEEEPKEPSKDPPKTSPPSP